MLMERLFSRGIMQMGPSRVDPARKVGVFVDVGSARFSFHEKTSWVNMVSPDGQETPNITVDPFSNQWIYLLIKGSYGILRSPGWTGDTIAFTGLLTMIGVDTEWRLTLTRHCPDAFSFRNEERADDGSWAYIDQWRFKRILTGNSGPERDQ